MGVINFSFTRINAEKKGPLKGKINIKNDISVKNIEEHELAQTKEKKALKVTCDFLAKYAPDFAQIEMTGEVIYVDDAKKIDDVLKDWKDSKKLPKEVMTAVMNTALQKCNIQALIMSKEINLPPPVPLPKVSAEKKVEK
ncbi:hypothetical protein GF336_00485 [Candidatus Woesearchaeota archaeon]|nr:hypothetical protein [Candidatus Woesearchaeota archaeon]